MSACVCISDCTCVVCVSSFEHVRRCRIHTYLQSKNTLTKIHTLVIHTDSDIHTHMYTHIRVYSHTHAHIHTHTYEFVCVCSHTLRH